MDSLNIIKQSEVIRNCEDYIYKKSLMDSLNIIKQSEVIRNCEDYIFRKLYT